MTILKRKTHFIHGPSERLSPSFVDIYNWRYIIRGEWRILKNYKNKGIMILLNREQLFIPNTTIEEVNKINQNPPSYEKYFLTVYGYFIPPLCYKCKGAGKIDWVEEAMTGRPATTSPSDRFVRDISEFYTHPDSQNHIFAKTMLQEGEKFCSRCDGFGVELDGRYRVFKLKRLRDNLIRHTMSDEDHSLQPWKKIKRRKTYR